MLGWIVLALLGVVGMALMMFAHSRWGRGAQSDMSVNMESESASYTNYLRGPRL